MTCPIIDTHAHLDDQQFQDDLELVLQRAASAGVRRIVTIATTAASSKACVALAATHPILAATVGIQPNNIAEASPDDWNQVVELVHSKNVVALGETGLDRHWDYTPFDQQEDYFDRHLDLARRQGLPVVIHCRKAEADVVRMLRLAFDRHGPVRAVMHSFTGDMATAQACLAMGLYISFAGMLTYKNADDLRTVASQLPWNRLVVETDSPYLAPVPMRGKRNEPSYLSHTLTCLAKIHAVEIERLAEETTQNAMKLFGFAAPA